MTDGVDELFTTRAFAWGVLVIGDAESSDIPSLHPGETIASSDSTVVVRVCHAQDVADVDESEFLVSVRVAQGIGESTEFGAVIAVTSGRMSVGDANAADIIKLEPGAWRLDIEAEPEDVPERVTVWLAHDDA